MDEMDEMSKEEKALIEDKIKELMEGNVGIQFNGAVPGSLATKTDLHYQDLLVEVNGVPVKNITDYVAGRELNSECISMTFLRPSTHKLYEIHMDFETSEVTQKIYG